MQDSHRLPANFNPWKAVAALKGIAMTIEWFITEGPGADHPMTRDAQVTLEGLVYASRLFADQVHAYLEKLEKAGFELPQPGEESSEDTVREKQAAYSVN